MSTLPQDESPKDIGIDERDVKIARLEERLKFTFFGLIISIAFIALLISAIVNESHK